MAKREEQINESDDKTNEKDEIKDQNKDEIKDNKSDVNDDNISLINKENIQRFLVELKQKTHHLLILTVDFIAFAVFIILHKFYTKLSKPLFMEKIIKKSNLIITEKKHGELIENEKYDLIIINDRMYAKTLAYGMSGFIEAYIEQHFECSNIETLLFKIAESDAIKFFGSHIYPKALRLIHKLFDVNTVENMYAEYGLELCEWDLDVFRILCAPHMLFSTANFSKTNVYKQATIDQMACIATKLNLRKGMTVLDIGCGFGIIPEYLAVNYGVKVVGVTMNKVMVDFAREACTSLNVNIQQLDYREIEGKYDRILCIEAFEYIGERNWTTFFEKVNDLLNDDGLFLLQTTTINQTYMNMFEPVFERFLGVRRTFPRFKDIADKSNGLFVVENYENIGYNCGLTWRTWLRNFQTHWPFLSNTHDERFYRITTAFLAYGSVLCRARKLHLSQTLFSKDGYRGGYQVNEDEKSFLWKL